ncbi:MAG: Rrf2 family transcriptional regulator [Candidatus Aquirickettsiella sp.]
MQLTRYSDYSLRALLYLSQMPKNTATIVEIADFYKISKNHLVKVVHHLADLGYIKTLQGKGGGVQLVPAARDRTLAEIVKKTEPNFYLVECFNTTRNDCIITDHCRMQKIFHHALKAFFQVLERYTLADLDNSNLTQQISSFLNSNIS